MHYAKVVKTRFEVVNFDKLILNENVIRLPNSVDKKWWK